MSKKTISNRDRTSATGTAPAADPETPGESPEDETAGAPSDAARARPKRRLRITKMARRPGAAAGLADETRSEEPEPTPPESELEAQPRESDSEAQRREPETRAMPPEPEAAAQTAETEPEPPRDEDRGLAEAQAEPAPEADAAALWDDRALPYGDDAAAAQDAAAEPAGREDGGGDPLPEPAPPSMVRHPVPAESDGPHRPSRLRGLLLVLLLLMLVGAALYWWLRPTSAPEAPQAPPAAELDLEARTEIEQLLSNMAIDPGPVDGVVDEQTRAAIRTYQEIGGLPVDGEPSAALLKELREVADELPGN